MRHYTNTSLRSFRDQAPSIKLKSLSPEELAELNAKGFLGPLYAILFSIFQLNALIRRFNAQAGSDQIQRISLEIAKDMHRA